MISDPAKNKIYTVMYNIETGRSDPSYSSLVVLQDGKNQTSQITYGKLQTTEQGNLKELLQIYISLGGKYSAEFSSYMPYLKNIPLHNNQKFIDLLIEAGEDNVMHIAQDKFFDSHYYIPALTWFQKNNFALPLSLLVIFDSFIQSGGIPTWLRNTFTENVPANNGDEKNWIIEYLSARKNFLVNHKNKAVQNSVYRINILQSCIPLNWNLTAPIYRGTKIIA